MYHGHSALIQPFNKKTYTVTKKKKTLNNFWFIDEVRMAKKVEQSHCREDQWIEMKNAESQVISVIVIREPLYVLSVSIEKFFLSIVVDEGDMDVVRWRRWEGKP